LQLGSCLRLTILSLRTNNLSSIPDEIGRIPNLHVLNLSDNQLRSLPFGLMKLKRLAALWLADNQVCRFSVSWCELCYETFRIFLKIVCIVKPVRNIHKQKKLKN